MGSDRHSAASHTFPTVPGGKGLAFQQIIDQTNAAYRKLGVAFITRKAIPGKYVLPPRRPGQRMDARHWSDALKSDGLKSGQAVSSAVFRQWLSASPSSPRHIFVPDARAEPDYGGVVGPNGRAIAYDAKSTRRERLDFDNLHPHQMDFLEAMAACGAIAGFLVEFTVHRSVFFVPVQLVKIVHTTSTRRSLPYPLCATHLVPAPVGQQGILWDYLAVVEEQEHRYGRDYGRLQVSLPACPKTRNRLLLPERRKPY